MSAAAQASPTTLLELPLTGRPVIRPVVQTLAESVPDFGAMARRNRRLAQLERDMEAASTYAAWREAALAWDTESGLESWKLDDSSPLYDYKLIQRRLAQILAAREGGYVRRLMFLLQEGLHGNLGNLSNPLLYQCTRFGTKRLVERYLDEVSESLIFICEIDSPEITAAEKREFFETTSQTFGQSCLMLSGGAALGIYHLGVVQSLWESGLLPTVISGSSAGSIVAAIIGTRTDAELRGFLGEREGMVELIRRNRLPRPWLFDVEHFNQALRELVPPMSFQEAYRHSGRAINVTVTSEDRHSDDRVMNHRTSPNVVITSAVRASCAAPFLMPPAELYAKTINGETIAYMKGRKFLDGSIGDDLPMRRLTRLYGVNHSIVSMVNPVVLPFASRRSASGSDARSQTRGYLTRILKETANFSLGMVQRAVPGESIGFAIEKLRAVMTQEYRGDITLVPPRRLAHLFNLLRNHSAAEEREFVRIGARLTWPHLEMIKNTTAISRSFRFCTERLAAREARGGKARAGRKARSRSGK